MTALISAGELIIPHVEAALLDDSGKDKDAIIRLLRVCGQIPGSVVGEFLKQYLKVRRLDVQPGPVARRVIEVSRKLARRKDCRAWMHTPTI